MSKEKIKFTKTHEWIRKEDDNTVVIGITDYAKNSLGDIVYVAIEEIPEIISQDQEITVIESVKAASGIYSPISGVLLEVNVNLKASPELVNESPYDKGWILKIKISNKEQAEKEWESLLSEEEYNKIINITTC